MKFQNCILINFVMDTRTDARTDKPKAIAVIVVRKCIRQVFTCGAHLM